ncbi:MAG: dockerin type I repeat-containing protein [Clostridia bacterium]|nr:dockerin type I repeat-containing protein [Clostridia bacterium]
MKFDESIKVNQNEIFGLNIKENTAEKVKEKIETIYTIQMYDYTGQKLASEDYVGTGCKIRLVDENNIIKMEYDVIVYGDVNGDGKINSIDLLVLQRHILEIEKLKGVFLKAGNINKNGNNPSSLDSLLIQRHILELKFIQQ